MEVEAGLVLLEGNLNPSLTTRAKTWVNNSLPLAFNNANILILIAINDRINPYVAANVQSQLMYTLAS